MFETAEVKMDRNIEIKARIGSNEEFEKKVSIAKNLTSSSGELITQKDVFFNSPKCGRLKLRYLHNDKAQLVFYDRPDVAGPKLSSFHKTVINEPEILENILASSNGTRGILKKDRLLFLHNQSRIHLDKVEDLGNFLEFEVCLQPEQSVKDGQLIAEDLMKVFQIDETDLMTGAYFDELEKIQDKKL